MNDSISDLAGRYPVSVHWSAEDDEYVATSPPFPYLSALAPTREEALAEFQVVLEMVIETARDDGTPLPDPEPPVRTYSGNLRVRLPRSLHRDLDSAAHADNVSLNTFIVTQLSRALGRPDSA